MKDDNEQDNPFEIVAYKMESEGFDYCFTKYSSWPEIEDQVFHSLREAYKNAQKALKDYIATKVELDEEI